LDQQARQNQICPKCNREFTPPRQGGVLCQACRNLNIEPWQCPVCTYNKRRSSVIFKRNCPACGLDVGDAAQFWRVYRKQGNSFILAFSYAILTLTFWLLKGTSFASESSLKSFFVGLALVTAVSVVWFVIKGVKATRLLKKQGTINKGTSTLT